MYKILSKWAGDVTAACFRCGITQQELATESGLSRTYVSGYLRDNYEERESSKKKIEHGLRLCIAKRGVPVEEFFPAEERPG